MPTDENLATKRNSQPKIGLTGKSGGRAEISSVTDDDYEVPRALGDPFTDDWNISPATGASEVQTLRIQNGTGGTFTITFTGQTTAAIAHDATAQAVEDALNALSNVNPGDIEVEKTGTTADHTYTLRYGGEYHKENVAQITVDATNIAGAETVTIATSTAGSPT